MSVLSWAKGHDKSVVSGIWRRQVGAIQEMFSGGTDEALEDKALKILLKAGSYAELAFMVNRLTWDVLDDELDEQDNTQIAERLSVLRDPVEHTVDGVFRGLSLSPGSFPDIPVATITQSIHQRLGFLGDLGRMRLANDLLARRVPLLNAIALFALRDMPTRSRELVILLDDLASHTPALHSSLSSLRWEAFYENLICVQLEQARYRLLVATLPDMMDPNLPAERRLALFDTLNRRDDEFRAMQTFIGVLGTVEQRTAVDRFMDARQLFMDNFTPAPPTPGTIQAVAAFFDSVASEIVGLRADVATFAQDSSTL
ncbi:MAG TPA: hypothetical protein PLZ79_02385 [Burkholderiales bacterium]|nr:hypothetical protein [Burkholderiales bacterium]